MVVFSQLCFWFAIVLGLKAFSVYFDIPRLQLFLTRMSNRTNSWKFAPVYSLERNGCFKKLESTNFSWGWSFNIVLQDTLRWCQEVTTTKLRVVSTRIPEEVYNVIEELARKYNVSIYVVVQKALIYAVKQMYPQIEKELQKYEAEQRAKKEGICLLWKLISKHIKLNPLEKMQYDKYFEQICGWKSA